MNDFVGTDRVTSRATGKVVGFDAVTGYFYPLRDRRVLQLSFAFKGGLLLARVHFEGPSTDFRGRVTGGTGKFRGATGTVRGHLAQGGNPVTLKYVL